MLKKVGVVFALCSAVGLIACEPVQEIRPGTFPQSSSMVISEDGNTIFVALPDNDKVLALDTEKIKSGDGAQAVKSEVNVTGQPHRLTMLDDGRVAVSARQAGEVSVLDRNVSRIESTVEVGAEPYGLLQVDDQIVVAVAGQKELARIPVSDPTYVEDRVLLEHEQPRGLAKTQDGKLYVSHFIDSKLTRVDSEAGVPAATIELKLASNERFYPNQADVMTVTPEGELVVPHQQDNNDPEQFASGQDLSGQTVHYYSTGPTGYPAVLPTSISVDTESDVVVSDGPGEWNTNTPQGAPERGGRVGAVINPLATNNIGNARINSPAAVAIADGGKLELIVNRGSGNVFIRKTQIADGERSLVGTVDAGVGAESIVLSPDGATAYVFNAFTYEVTAFAVPHVETTSNDSALGKHQSNNIWDPVGTRPEIKIETLASSQVATSDMPEEQRKGRKLFHDVGPAITFGGAVSCASCHPGGAADGTSWAFEEGRRQTPPLWGGAMETAPFHWDNSFRDMNDLNSVTIVNRMGGEGLTPDDLDLLSTYINAIPVPAAPMNADENSVIRGREIFFSDASGCTECHNGAHFTDNLAHNVGTGVGTRQGETKNLFSTPLLHGLSHTGPYLHDGRVETLRDVVEEYVRNDKMGTGAHLTDQDADDLAAFLRTL